MIALSLFVRVDGMRKMQFFGDLAGRLFGMPLASIGATKQLYHEKFTFYYPFVRGTFWLRL